MSDLRCHRCDKPLIRYAGSVTVRGEVIGWGPRCWAVTFPGKRARREPTARIRRDERTRDWVRELAE